MPTMRMSTQLYAALVCSAALAVGVYFLTRLKQSVIGFPVRSLEGRTPSYCVIEPTDTHLHYYFFFKVNGKRSLDIESLCKEVEGTGWKASRSRDIIQFLSPDGQWILYVPGAQVVEFNIADGIRGSNNAGPVVLEFLKGSSDTFSRPSAWW